MLTSIFTSKAINKLPPMNQGLAGNNNWWPRGMIIDDLL
jgi:hypothetical protein